MKRRPSCQGALIGVAYLDMAQDESSKMVRRNMLLMSLLLASGCAGVSATNIGQTAGTIAGSVIAPGVGGPVGALVGLLAGLVVQGQVDQSTEKRERRDLNKELAADRQAGSSEPTSPHGVPTRVWVDEALYDGRVIVAHFDVRYL